MSENGYCHCKEIMQAQPLEAAKTAAKGYARAVKELSFKEYSEMFMAVWFNARVRIPFELNIIICIIREMGAKIRTGFFALEAAFL